MCAATVTGLWKFPLKGAAGNRSRELLVDAGTGIEGDRVLAVRRQPGNMDEWAPKREFFVCMNTPQMAVQRPIIWVDSPENPDDIGGLDERFTSRLAKELGVGGELRVQNTKGSYSLADRPGGLVSFLNLASVRALSKFAGTFIAPERFRMNVWLEGLEPFEELAWIEEPVEHKRIRAGTCAFGGWKECVRCRAIEASPETGTYDVELCRILSELMKSRNYRSPKGNSPLVMGVLAAPLSSGMIRLEDELALLD